MCILNTRSAIKRMGVKQFKDFIFENCYRRIRFTKENSYYSMRCQKKKTCYWLQPTKQKK